MGNQVEKFRRKWKKEKEDERVIQESQPQTDDDRFGIEGTEDLKEAGNMKEAAAVFSYNGLRFLADNYIEPMIERSLDKKLTELFEGLSLGLERLIQDKAQAQAEKMIEDKFKEIKDFDWSAIPMRVHEPTKEEPVKEEPKKEEKTPTAQMGNSDITWYKGGKIDVEPAKETKKPTPKELDLSRHSMREALEIEPPVANGRIRWSSLTTREATLLAFAYLYRAEQQGTDVSVGDNVRKISSDIPYAAAAQFLTRKYPKKLGAWSRVMEVYNKLKENGLPDANS